MYAIAFRFVTINGDCGIYEGEEIYPSGTSGNAKVADHYEHDYECALSWQAGVVCGGKDGCSFRGAEPFGEVGIG